MRVIYTRYGVVEVPETSEEIETHTRKMRETNPNYIPLMKTGRATECTCDCHKPGYVIMHCFPCC